MSTHDWEGIELPGDMIWIDENADLLAQQEIRTLNGKLVIFSTGLTAGRPFTLSGHPDGDWKGAWISWNTVAALLEMVTPGRLMTVQYGNRAPILVTWSGNKPIDYRPVTWTIEPKSATQQYTVELRAVLIDNLIMITPAQTEVYPGQLGAPGPVTITRVAAATLNEHRVVRLNADNQIIYADCTVLDDSSAVIGLTTIAGDQGDYVIIQTEGEIIESSWNWDIDAPVFLSTQGQLTQIQPAEAFALRIGVALSPTRLLIRIGEPIFL